MPVILTDRSWFFYSSPVSEADLYRIHSRHNIAILCSNVNPEDVAQLPWHIEIVAITEGVSIAAVRAISSCFQIIAIGPNVSAQIAQELSPNVHTVFLKSGVTNEFKNNLSKTINIIDQDAIAMLDGNKVIKRLKRCIPSPGY